MGPHDLSTWWPSTARFFDEAPDHVWVVRKRDDPVGFMIIATSDDESPIADDPMLVPWIEHARGMTDGGTAVIWRNARTLNDDAAVQGLLGAAGLALSGVANPRFLYLPIDPLYPGAEAFSASLGAQHVPELDVDLGDGVTQCHIVDTGPGGTLGAQLAAVLAECGDAPVAVATAPIDEAAVRASAARLGPTGPARRGPVRRGRHPGRASAVGALDHPPGGGDRVRVEPREVLLAPGPRGGLPRPHLHPRAGRHRSAPEPQRVLPPPPRRRGTRRGRAGSAHRWMRREADYTLSMETPPSPFPGDGEGAAASGEAPEGTGYPPKFAKEGLTFDDVLLRPGRVQRPARRGQHRARGSRRRSS